MAILIQIHDRLFSPVPLLSSSRRRSPSPPCPRRFVVRPGRLLCHHNLSIFHSCSRFPCCSHSYVVIHKNTHVLVVLGNTRQVKNYKAITNLCLILLAKSNPFPRWLSNTATGTTDLDDVGLGTTRRPGCFCFPVSIFLHLLVRVLLVLSCLFLILILIVTFVLVDLPLTRRSGSGIIIHGCFTANHFRRSELCYVRSSGQVSLSKNISAIASLPSAVSSVSARCRVPSTTDFH